ncbi:MAG TPA: hypothetical protein VI755_11640 [Anaerolineales bacterium]|nr:hypothetical protein [Anaerolineales bacterium]
MAPTIFLAIALLLMALERFGVAVPGWLTGIFLALAGILLLI